MSADDLARLLQARKCGVGRWRARCPVHRSKGLTLAIHAGEDRTRVFCHAGCSSDDVLATLGLTWKDTLYRDSRLTPEERRAWAKRKYITELYAREQRLQDLNMMLEAIERSAHRRIQRTATKFDVMLYRFTDNGDPIGRDWQKEAGDFVRSQHRRWLIGEFD